MYNDFFLQLGSYMFFEFLMALAIIFVKTCGNVMLHCL